jgi:hypothetical protein
MGKGQSVSFGSQDRLTDSQTDGLGSECMPVMSGFPASEPSVGEFSLEPW